jgi:hypothetical protein
MERRLEFSLAALSVAASTAPTLLAIFLRISGQSAGEDDARLLIVTALPILLTIVGLWAARGDRDWVTWTAIGGLWGFVIVGAWSVGLFFVPAALLLSASGLARVDARRAWWNVLLVPLWAIEGVSAIAILLLLIAIAREILGYARFVLPGQTREFSTEIGTISFVPETVMSGAWLFAGMSCFLTACYVVRDRKIARTQRWNTRSIRVMAVLLLTLVGAAATRRAIGELQRSGASSCSSAGGRTICIAG